MIELFEGRETLPLKAGLFWRALKALAIFIAERIL
jgi:hypothetical protein